MAARERTQDLRHGTQETDARTKIFSLLQFPPIQCPVLLIFFPFSIIPQAPACAQRHEVQSQQQVKETVANAATFHVSWHEFLFDFVFQALCFVFELCIRFYNSASSVAAYLVLSVPTMFLTVHNPLVLVSYLPYLPKTPIVWRRPSPSSASCSAQAR